MNAPSIYHIGCMKSGTTTLQAVLREDPRIQLIEHSRFFDSDRWFTGSYPSVDSQKWSIESDENIARQYGGMTGPRVALERIHSCRPDAHIVLTIREQSGALLSGYKHHIRQTFDAYSFERFLRSDAGVSFRKMLRYDLLVKEVLELFPREKLHVFLYENFKADPLNFLARFYQELFGLDAPAWEPETRRSGVPSSRIRLKRRLNGLKGSRSGTLLHALEAPFIRALFRCIGYFYPKTGDDREFLRECPYFEEVMEEYGESNARLLEMIDLPLQEKGYRIG